MQTQKDNLKQKKVLYFKMQSTLINDPAMNEFLLLNASSKYFAIFNWCKFQ